MERTERSRDGRDIDSCCPRMSFVAAEELHGES